ncbi:hypothetical protein D3C73_841930 [compost metagenome]
MCQLLLKDISQLILLDTHRDHDSGPDEAIYKRGGDPVRLKHISLHQRRRPHFMSDLEIGNYAAAEQ